MRSQPLADPAYAVPKAARVARRVPAGKVSGALTLLVLVLVTVTRRPSNRIRTRGFAVRQVASRFIAVPASAWVALTIGALAASVAR
ncbi:MAG: hypothetical protein V9G19_09010 [Tetrasphaera sp.]